MFLLHLYFNRIVWFIFYFLFFCRECKISLFSYVGCCENYQILGDLFHFSSGLVSILQLSERHDSQLCIQMCSSLACRFLHYMRNKYLNYHFDHILYHSFSLSRFYDRVLFTNLLGLFRRIL